MSRRSVRQPHLRPTAARTLVRPFAVALNEEELRVAQDRVVVGRMRSNFNRQPDRRNQMYVTNRSHSLLGQSLTQHL